MAPEANPQDFRQSGCGAGTCDENGACQGDWNIISVALFDLFSAKQHRDRPPCYVSLKTALQHSLRLVEKGISIVDKTRASAS